MFCARHPTEETSLTCSRCETPICTRCMVHADVGIRCRDCAPPRASGTRRGVSLLGAGIVVLLVIVVATSLAGSRNSGSDAGYDDYLDVMEEFQGDVTVNELVDPWKPETGNEQPSPGRRFVAVDVTIENPGGGDLPVYAGTYMFKLTDSESYAYSAADPLAQPELPEDVELAPGEKTRGWVTFEIEAGNAIKALTYWGNEVALPE